MPLTAHRIDATDLPEYGTYTLRRALDQVGRRSDRVATGQNDRDDRRSQWRAAVRPWVGRRDRA